MTSYMPANAMFEFPDGEVVSNGVMGGGPSNQMKQGRVCCSGCCDMRRAVIIVDIIMIILLAFVVFFVFLGYEVTEMAAREDDASEDTVRTANEMKHMHIGWFLMYHICQIAAYGAAIKGAIKYDRNMVLLGFATYCFSFGLNIIFFSIGGILLTAFFAYPHFYLAQEIKDNIMTPENYPNEVHSCCCI